MIRGEENQLVVALAVEGLAIIAHEDDRDWDAVELWGFAGELRAAAASPLPRARVEERDDHLRQARSRIGADLVERGLKAGSALSFDQVLALVGTV